MEAITSAKEIAVGNVVTIKYSQMGTHFPTDGTVHRQFHVEGIMGQVLTMAPIDGGAEHVIHVGDKILEKRGASRKVVGNPAFIENVA